VGTNCYRITPGPLSACSRMVTGALQTGTCSQTLLRIARMRGSVSASQGNDELHCSRNLVRALRQPQVSEDISCLHYGQSFLIKKMPAAALRVIVMTTM